MRQDRRRVSRAGLTLVESAISTVIVGVMLATALTTLGGAARARHGLADRQRARALVYELMTEVIATPFEEPDDTPAFGPEPGEDTSTRADFDDVDDYSGWSASPPQTVRGKVIDGLTGWTRTVAVSWADANDPKTLSGPGELKAVTVTVTDPRGGVSKLTALRSAAGALEQPAAAGDFTSWMGSEIQIGPNHESGLISGTALLNAPPAVTPNLLLNPGLEAGSADGWRVYGGSATLAATTFNPHSGAYRVEISGRASSNAGPGQDLTDRLVSGATYEADLWTYTPPFQMDQLRITLQLDSTGDGVVTLSSSWVWIGGSWTKLSATFVPTWTGTLTSAHIRVESKTASMDFRIDDARFMEVP